jgi:hypothetical protein
MITQDELDVFVNELIDEQFEPTGVNSDGET